MRGLQITRAFTTSSQKTEEELQNFFTKGARLTHAAHLIWEMVGGPATTTHSDNTGPTLRSIFELLRPGDIVVDATCGNGHDSTFLAARVGPKGM
eukprot:scaffold139837_cov29-Prasinocladus_malaysianus.AAC.1